MRRLFTALTCLLLLITAEGNSQARLVYTTNLEAFAGTWRGVHGDEYFILKLKVGKENTDMFYGRCLIGGYKREKNGVVLIDRTQNLPNEITEEYYQGISCPSLFGTNGTTNPDYVTPEKVRFFFYDESYGEEALRGRITLINANMARFEVWEMDYPGARERGPISVPINIILTKETGVPGGGSTPLPTDPRNPPGQTANPHLP